MKTLFLALLLTPAFAQTPDPHSIPAVDAGIGQCTAAFTITDTDNKPIYAAKVKVHIAYGFASDGKARFTSLPDRSKKGLFFEASEGDRTGTAFLDPSKTCQAQFTIALRKPTTAQKACSTIFGTC